MSNTPNHEYNTPAEGAKNWHVPLNNNFEAFDTDIELRDVESNLSSYTPADGAKFFATDTGIVYLGNGNNWVSEFVFPSYDSAADEAQFDRRASIVSGDSIAEDRSSAGIHIQFDSHRATLWGLSNGSS